jgi:hypothetical protein
VTQHRSDCWTLDSHAPDGMHDHRLASTVAPYRKTGLERVEKTVMETASEPASRHTGVTTARRHRGPVGEFDLG